MDELVLQHQTCSSVYHREDNSADHRRVVIIICYRVLLPLVVQHLPMLTCINMSVKIDIIATFYEH
jgi:hypothetical protein